MLRECGVLGGFGVRYPMDSLYPALTPLPAGTTPGWVLFKQLTPLIDTTPTNPETLRC